MTDARAFRGFRFPAGVILWAVRWYLQFPVSYRDLEAMLADRGVAVDHVSLFRWVQRFAPELEKRTRRHLRRHRQLAGRRSRRMGCCRLYLMPRFQ
jgi:transposase-like protein